MTTLFISDLHLEETRPDITDAFLRFLDQKTSGIERLYILGDFFEAWIGDDEQTPLQETIAGALKAVSDRGVEIFLMHGNRDFLIGEEFCERAGATLLDDPTVVDLYGTPTLLMHGDSLCTADEEYQKFRANMRNPQMQKMMLARPLEDRQKMARQLRDMSMAKNQGKAEDIMDVTPEEVVREMETHGVQQMIHGHTHRPAIHDLQANGQPATRIVLGDWDENVWWLEAAPGQAPELRKEALK
ncbi:UDP-2,3-diacylglucosamine diphosphatase [Marinobacter persicus]|uniref:UDP-2,3-diacylglucosamine hydrolase n=1 Tax=Marinobacter persicus TaxID=930118 RepID=A0A2S6G2S1_9GAMM|nr:UDP-2,3-diacylglucosamine diphosphatase [Marinobacter persicus]PPK50139.1 UDP-2,3-diacylglucosamine hydrolase [Marinobacter persicus]PPK52261.1 UDP-2,3-diacylglucosamine hydrolase [Marinobacter persicus]PPK56812.1 UDP-2,3-diacylglucosamine hydrolase [Marinobacter persicus]